MRILFFGDVVGGPGCRAIKELLPAWRAEHQIDAVIANVENLAHGKGITPKTLGELLSAGVDYCTSGNHVLFKDGRTMLADPAVPVLRPANFPAAEPGRGAHILTVGDHRLLLINLIGTTFFNEGATYANPFATVDAILKEQEHESLNGIIVDFHAEATSEKVAMGWHLDGRVSAVFGTHTHVPTADLRILPGGTAFQSDVGMTGERDQVIGVDRDLIIHNFLHPDDTKAHRWTEGGAIQAHAVLLEIDPQTRKAVHCATIDRDLGA